MGMLTLAGAVSGGGKALQQGLQQTQQYMSQSMVLKEREDMELRRLDITYGKEAGLMRERQKFDLEREDRQHSRAVDLAEDRQDFEMRKGRIERNAAREDAATQAERQRERDVQNKVLDASFQAQRDADQAKRDRAKEADRKGKRGGKSSRRISAKRLSRKRFAINAPMREGLQVRPLESGTTKRRRDIRAL